MKRHPVRSGLLWGLLLPLAVTVILLFFTAAFNSLNEGSSQESMAQLQDAIRRSCMACYAAEGAYPPNLEYIQEYYGVQIDEKKYTVHYMVIADNLMPDITVLENRP